MVKNFDMDKFDALLAEIKRGTLLTGVLSSPWSKEAYQKITLRPVQIKGALLYQLTEHDMQKVVHRNLTFEQCVVFIKESFPEKFRQGIFTASNYSYHLLVNKQKAMTIIKKAIQPFSGIPLAHNRSKKYLLPEGKPIDFLVELGIMTSTGQVVAKKYDKFRQINRFVEMVSDVMTHLPKDRCIEVIDFGCGKAYLTFALYYYLHSIMQLQVRMVGLDLKEDVIEFCQALAVKLNYAHLSFAVGDINSHQAKGKVDLVISLHACDTATDAALEKALQWDAEVILSVPCCQHELYNQVTSVPLASLLRHGILRERFAALVTDAARAELLTTHGYSVQILEFIDMEHTPKNLLIRAVKGCDNAKQMQAKERYAAFKAALSIDPSLERRLYSI